MGGIPFDYIHHVIPRILNISVVSPQVADLTQLGVIHLKISAIEENQMYNHMQK